MFVFVTHIKSTFYIIIIIQMRQGSYKNIVSAQKERSKDVGYRTQIVAGVIRRIPIQVHVC